MVVCTGGEKSEPGVGGGGLPRLDSWQLRPSQRYLARRASWRPSTIEFNRSLELLSIRRKEHAPTFPPSRAFPDSQCLRMHAGTHPAQAFASFDGAARGSP